jgi:hypothetical protein
MDIKKLTVYFIGLCVLAIIGYDVYAIIKGGTEASISYTIYSWSYKYPIFTFACGVLAGHFFWRIRDTKGTKQISDDSRK